MFTEENVRVRKWQQGDEAYLLEITKKQKRNLSMYEIRTFLEIDADCYLVAVDSGDIPVGKRNVDLFYMSSTFSEFQDTKHS